MLAAILVPLWRTLSPAHRIRQIVYTTLLLAGLGALVTYDLLSPSASVATHVRINSPGLLLLLLPLIALLLILQYRTLSGISRGRMWFAYLLRSSMLVLLLLAVAGLQMVVEKDTLSVFYVLDASKSVPNTERQRAIDFIRKSVEFKQPDDKVGMLLFGGKADWEVSPAVENAKPQFFPDAAKVKSRPDTDSTNIALALQRAVSRADEDARRRIVLFTDGRQTSGDAADELKRIVSMGVDVWVVPLRRGSDAEMLVEKVVLPNELLWEQPFDAHVFVYSNINTRAEVRLFLGDKVGKDPDPQTVNLAVGKNRVTFPHLRMHSGGAKEVQATVVPLDARDDTLSENNSAYAFTDVATENRVLILTSDVDEVKHLLAALEGEKMTLDVRSGINLPDSNAYRAYDCIVLANLARGFLSEEQMKVIKTCVEDQGAGLVMIGGDQSFGAGGYLGTPIEEVLPVSMELRNKEVMPSGALCIVLHTCEFADGNSWGKKISKAAIKTLSPDDFAGLVYYNHGPGEMWAFKPAKVRPQMFQLIDGCDPGDMPTLDPIVAMATTALKNLPNVSLKHCIVITDGDPSPPTTSTLAAAKAAKISITVITIAPHGGGDIGAMKRIAAETGGRYYSADDPRKLPQIFIKEAAVVRKSLIRSDEKGIPIALGVQGPTLKEFGNKFPDVHAFVVTEPKTRAEMQLYTVVEGQKVPILSSWHVGLGKSVAFTSDATNRWATNWVSWPSYKKFWANTLTWASRQRMPSNHTVTTRIEGETARVIVEGLNEKGEYLNFAKLIGNAIDPDVTRAGKDDGKTYELEFLMTAPGRYEATFPVQKAGAYAITVIDQSDPKKPNAIVTGLANSYSAEFLHLDADEALLEKLGKIASDHSKAENKSSRLKDLNTLDPKTSGVYAHDLPPSKQPTDLFWPLLLVALCLFPLDIAVRRLALDPEKGFLFVWDKLSPVIAALSLKKKALQDAAAQSIAGAAPVPPPPDIVPTGEQSRAAQSMYEKAGQSAEFNLNPTAGTENKPVVGGTKVSQADPAASDYTSALLKAKKRAKKDQ